MPGPDLGAELEAQFTFTALTSPSATATATGIAHLPVARDPHQPAPEGLFTTFMDAMTWWNKETPRRRWRSSTQSASPAERDRARRADRQVLNPQRGASDQEIEGQVVSIVGRCNTDTALSTDLARSPFVIVLG